MAKLTVKIQDQITNNLSKKIRQIEALPDSALKVWIENTPRQSGRARRSTRLSGNEIQANYPYARRLDSGWSNQSPEGMSQPTGEFIRKEMNKITRGR
jgi:hypothetical protein